jgi:uncharacterized protein DUF6958
MGIDFFQFVKKNAKKAGKNLLTPAHVFVTTIDPHMANTEGDFIFLHTSSRVFTKVSKETYSLVTGLILGILEQKPRLTIIELIEEIGTQAKGFKGDLPWHVLHIKADLESRKLIRCQTGIGPERNQFIQKCRINKFNRFEMKWLLKFKNDLRHS